MYYFFNWFYLFLFFNRKINMKIYFSRIFFGYFCGTKHNKFIFLCLDDVENKVKKNEKKCIEDNVKIYLVKYKISIWKFKNLN